MKLKELRKKSGYSQKELAELLGYAQNTISQWESGRRYIDREALIQLANFFGVSTDYLLGRTVDNDCASDPLRNRLLNIFNNLNDIGKKEAIKRINELSQLKIYQSEKMPIAAHNDTVDDNELKLMQDDIDEL